MDLARGPVDMVHAVRPAGRGCHVEVELHAPSPLEALLVRTYGPLVAALVVRLADLRGVDEHMTGAVEPAGGLEKPKLPPLPRSRACAASHTSGRSSCRSPWARRSCSPRRTASATAAAGIYAASVATLFGTSALYHRINWRTDRPPLDAAARPLGHLPADRRLYTPFAILVIDGTMAEAILPWSGAGRSRHPAQAGVDRRAEVAGRGGVRGARLGGRDRRCRR